MNSTIYSIYTIKPLVWVQTDLHEYQASNAIDTYLVRKDGRKWITNKYCNRYDTDEKAMLACDGHWQDLMQRCLNRVNE